jgi:DNA-binding HxlR family transcriptional regulator
MSSEASGAHGPTAALSIDRPRFARPARAFDAVQPVVGRKWNLRIVYHLLEDGPTGFSGLKDAVDGISSKMLSESLSTLEERELVDRTIVSEKPFRVEYSLTERGAALEAAVYAIVGWGRDHAAVDGDAE